MSFDSEALRDLESELWRAPSPHNTQPWLLDHDDSGATLRWDPARTLPVADPTMRDHFLALGAFVETAEIVTADAGCPLRFKVDIDVSDTRTGRFDPGDPYSTPFDRSSVRARVCARDGYEPGELDEGLLTRARDAAAMDDGSVALHAGIEHVPSRELIATLVDADRHMWRDPAVTRELRSWMRLTTRDPRYRQDGLTWEAMAMQYGEAVALRMLLASPVYRMLRPLGLPGLLASFVKPLLDYDGSVLVLTGPAPLPDEPAATTHATELAMGRALLRTWLQLGADGISVHPLSEIIDAPETYAALAECIGLPTNRRVFAIFRAGRAATTPAPSHRLRR